MLIFCVSFQIQMPESHKVERVVYPTANERPPKRKRKCQRSKGPLTRSYHLVPCPASAAKMSAATTESARLLGCLLAGQQGVYCGAHVRVHSPRVALDHLDAHVKRWRPRPLQHTLLLAPPSRLIVACIRALSQGHPIAHHRQAHVPSRTATLGCSCCDAQCIITLAAAA